MSFGQEEIKQPLLIVNITVYLEYTRKENGKILELMKGQLQIILKIQMKKSQEIYWNDLFVTTIKPVKYQCVNWRRTGLHS